MNRECPIVLKKCRFAWKLFGFLVVVAGVGASLFYAARSRATSESTSIPAAGQWEESLASTSPYTMSAAAIADVVPQAGKFIAADLERMVLALYQDGSEVAEYQILTKGRKGSPYETPAGFYTILTKERDHFNRKEQVHMPWSMQFYGNYFIHGWPYYTDGMQVNPNYSGGCIRLSTSDAERVYDFAEKGTGIFVYDPASASSAEPLSLGAIPAPSISAAEYLVADIDNGDVYLEQNAREPRPIASLTKLMTALVASETIMFNKQITVTSDILQHTAASASSTEESFVVGDLLYPLLMESNNAVADRLAQYYGTSGFVGWMNTTAKALSMQSTHFADPSGISAQNVSSPDDLYRLATYLANKKSFIFGISRTPTKDLTGSAGDEYHFNNFNIFSGSPSFIGGKVGQTAAAGNTMLSVFSVPINGVLRRVAVIVLKSDDYKVDTTKLVEWFTQSAQQGCVSCGSPKYRKIQ